MRCQVCIISLKYKTHLSKRMHLTYNLLYVFFEIEKYYFYYLLKSFTFGATHFEIEIVECFRTQQFQFQLTFVLVKFII